MAEYIEREALVDILAVSHAYHANNSREASLLDRDIRLIWEQPAADVAPVVHGRWIECDYVKYDGHSECIHYPKAAWKCSNCCNAFKKELLWKNNYCPNCGACMKDGE